MRDGPPSRLASQRSRSQLPFTRTETKCDLDGRPQPSYHDASRQPQKDETNRLGHSDLNEMESNAQIPVAFAHLFGTISTPTRQPHSLNYERSHHQMAGTRTTPLASTTRGANSMEFQGAHRSSYGHIAKPRDVGSGGCGHHTPTHPHFPHTT
jgi:hypothetical protein